METNANRRSDMGRHGFDKHQFRHMTLEDKGPLREGDIDEEPRRLVRVQKPNYKYEGYA